MRGLILLATIATALLTTPAAAQSSDADYVFNVPVRIENAPALNGATVIVECSVQAYNAAGMAIAAPRARQNITVGATGYHDTLHFNISLPEGVRRSDVVRWNCYMDLLNARNRRGELTPLTGPNSGAHIAQYPIVTGQTVRYQQTLVQA